MTKAQTTQNLWKKKGNVNTHPMESTGNDKTQKENGKENCKAKKTYKGNGGGKEDSPGAWQ